MPENLTLPMSSFPLIFVQLELASWALLVVVFAVSAQTLSGCQDRCGNISIPYPFGTSKECYIEENFLVTCNTSYDPPKLFLTTTSIEITNISLSGELGILSFIAGDCYGQQRSNHPVIKSPKFPISSTRNKFTAVGCDTNAFVEVSGALGGYSTGCLSVCPSVDSVINGSCSGSGCCQTSIPKGVWSTNITVSSYYNHAYVRSFNPCSYAFIVEETAYNFSSLDFINFQNRTKLPMVLDWAVGNQTCNEARKNLTSFACKENSDCYDFDNGPGYRCNCTQGFQGNPYIPQGCQDIDECSAVPSPCSGTCNNLPSSYNCSCPQGYEGDGRRDRLGCNPIASHNNKLTWIIIALVISISISVLLLSSSWLYWGLRQRKIIKLREKFFQQNGGIMLQHKVSGGEASAQSTKIFTEEELKKATNSYHESRVLGQGGHGTVYKGILPDNTIVAIKKSTVVDQSHSQIEEFINEVIILSQINHRNVVKLLGCCLETQVPLLVYEFISNGTLYDYIHTAGHNASSITWANRLRIATETATTLSYLHSAASTPIIHRDVKSTNILLDDHYAAKISDFGASRLIPINKTQFTTFVQGTLGYLDPEYFHTSQLSEKSDVYSFGVVLVELLTGKKALCFDRPEIERNLAKYFVSSMNEDRLFAIADEQVMREAKPDQLMEVATLAKRCLKVKGNERPTMREVAMELEGLRVTERHPWVNDNKNLDETEYLLGDQLSDAYGGGTSTSNSIAYDSMANHVISPFDGGR